MICPKCPIDNLHKKMVFCEYECDKEFNGYWLCLCCGFIITNEIEKITDLLRSWIGKQGHDSCWYYPTIFKSICDTLGVEWKEPSLPSRSDFEKGCCKFQQELFGVKIRCEECCDTQWRIDEETGKNELCWCYYAGGRAD